jgi:hypothetical protein
MLLDFDLNGLPMGRVARASASKRGRFAERRIRVKAAGTYPLDRVVIVRNGVEVYERRCDGMTAEVEWVDKESLAKARDRRIRGVYYYAKVYQQDRNMGWTSPVWIG